MSCIILIVTASAAVGAIALIISGAHKALNEMFDDWDEDHY